MLINMKRYINLIVIIQPLFVLKLIRKCLIKIINCFILDLICKQPTRICLCFLFGLTLSLAITLTSEFRRTVTVSIRDGS